jgi:hypothetical protein
LNEATSQPLAISPFWSPSWTSETEKVRPRMNE